MYAEQYGTLQRDEVDDYVTDMIEEMPHKTRITFTRKHDTCDTNDYVIDVSYACALCIVRCVVCGV